MTGGASAFKSVFLFGADLFKLHISRVPSPCWRITRTMVRLGTGSTLVSSVKKAVPRKSLCQNPFFSPRIIQQEVFFSIHSLCRYNHRNFCIHMATSHGFDSVAQIMARWLHSDWSSPLLLQNSDFFNELLQAPSPWHEDGVGKSVPRTPTCHRIVFCN